MKETKFVMPSFRRCSAMVIGVVIISLGIAIFKESGLGNDSISALNMRISDLLNMSLGTWNVIINLIFFVAQVSFGRKYIGLGTIVNGLCIGYIVTAFYNPIHAAAGIPGSFGAQLIWLLLGVVVTSFGVSLYQTADLGVAPYDYLSLGLRDLTKKPYFACRISIDALCAFICWLIGGLVGLGTLVCSFALGPLVSFFSRTVAEKWVGEKGII